MDKDTILNAIYQQALKRFYEAMQTVTIDQDEKISNYIKMEFNNITELLKLCHRGDIDINSIMLLNDISFSDFLQDKHIIEAVSSNCTTLNNNNLFVTKKNKYIDDYFTFFRIVETDGQYKTIRYNKGKIIEEDIDQSELDSFVSLQKALNDSEYVGLSARQWTYGVTILYSGKLYASNSYFTLYIGEKGTLEFYVTDEPYSTNGFFQHIYRTEKRNPYIKTQFNERRVNSDDDNADKKFILNAIEEQIEKQYGKSDNVFKQYTKSRNTKKFHN